MLNGHTNRVRWQKSFDNHIPHCAKDRDGVRHLYDDWDMLCTEDHSTFPQAVAPVEWRRFITEFNDLIERENNPFINTDPDKDDPDKILMLNGYHDYLIEGYVYKYCEEYWMKKVGKGKVLIFAIYLDNRNGVANISCFDNDYAGLAQVAYDNVRQNYFRGK